MKVYKISGKFRQNEEWSSIPEDFEGTIVVDEDSGIFKGVMKEKYDTPDPERFVCGIKRGKTLAFFKVANVNDIDPLIYLFKNYKKMGTWGVLMTIFSVSYCPQDKAKISLEPCDSESSDIIEQYQSRSEDGCWGFSSRMEENINLLEKLISLL